MPTADSGTPADSSARATGGGGTIVAADEIDATTSEAIDISKLSDLCIPVFQRRGLPFQRRPNPLINFDGRLENVRINLTCALDGGDY